MDQEDSQQLQRYHRGRNEPVGLWIGHKYYSPLLWRANRVLGDKALSKDALQDVALRLIEMVQPIRKKKFRPGQGGVRGALSTRVYHRAIDILRQRKGIVFTEDVGVPEPALDNDTLQRLQLAQEREILERYFLQRGWKEDWALLALWLEIGPGKQKELALAIGLDVEEVRKRQIRIKRRLDRYYLNPGNDN